jgi:hypothetical protein
MTQSSNVLIQYTDSGNNIASISENVFGEFTVLEGITSKKLLPSLNAYSQKEFANISDNTDIDTLFKMFLVSSSIIQMIYLILSEEEEKEEENDEVILSMIHILSYQKIMKMLFQKTYHEDKNQEIGYKIPIWNKITVSYLEAICHNIPPSYDLTCSIPTYLESYLKSHEQSRKRVKETEKIIPHPSSTKDTYYASQRHDILSPPDIREGRRRRS